MAYPSLGKMMGIASSLPLPFSRLSSCALFKALKCALVRVWIYALCKACKEFFPIDAQKKEKVAVLSLSQKVAEKDKV
jgi:hypothetical protein